MSLASVYSDGIEESLQRWAANPGPAPENSFKGISAIGIGLKSAALEINASFQELASGAAQSGLDQAARIDQYNASRGRPITLPDERRKEVAQQLQLSATAARQKAIDSAPDPTTTHEADQLLYGLARFGGKAIGAIGTLGPVGAIPLGLEEGNTVAQKLLTEGVDPGTAIKVGAIQGGIAAAGVVLPIGANTWAKTIGLIAAGGPGSFMAQAQLSKNILENAGYNDQASLYNPFDPLGLAVSTVLPGAFGGIHMYGVGKATKLAEIAKHLESGGNRYGKDGAIIKGPVTASGERAEGEMQVMPSTYKDPGYGIKPADLSGTAEQQANEIARVGREKLEVLVNRYGGDSDKALAAYNAGEGRVDSAIKKHGEDWLSKLPKETQNYVAKARKLTDDYVSSEAAKSPEAVDAARVSVLDSTVAKSLPDHPDAYENMMRAADIVAERGGREAEAEIKPIYAQPKLPEGLEIRESLEPINRSSDNQAILDLVTPPGKNDKSFRAEVNGKEVGHLDLAIGEDGKTAEVRDVVVAPEYRRMGIASELYNKATESGLSVKRSAHQTEEGAAFRTSYDERSRLMTDRDPNSLPPHDSVSMGETTKQAKESTKSEAPVEKSVSRTDVTDMRKRVSVIDSLIECMA